GPSNCVGTKLPVPSFCEQAHDACVQRVVRLMRRMRAARSSSVGGGRMSEHRIWRASSLQRGIAALGVALALLTLAVTPAAAEPAIEVLEAGWDGQAATATWTPVPVRVSSGNTDPSAIVEVVAEFEFSN